MTVLALSLRVACRLAVTTSLMVALALPATSTLAAPLHLERHFQMDDGGRGVHPFNIDPDPCSTPRFRAFGRGGDCPARPGRRGPHEGHGGPRGPGSNAFGLQFDMGGY